MELIQGGTKLSTELLDLKKKSLRNFLGMFEFSTVVSWILSLSKNLMRVFPRTHPGGNKTLNRTVGFEKKSLRNVLSMFKVL